MVRSALLLLALSLAAPPALAQDPLDFGLSAEEAARSGPDGLSFREAYRRTLLYSAGANHVFQARVRILLEHEVARRRELGRLPEGELVSEAELQAALEQAREEMAKQDPETPFWDRVALLGFSRERYLANLRQTLLFDRLFLPDDPELWDEEIHGPVFGQGEENGLWDSWIQRARDELRKKKEAGEETALDPQLKQILFRPTAMRWLLQQLPVVEPFQGLPEGVALKVGDVELRTEDLLRGMLEAIGPVERERAAAWVHVTWALQERLQEEGVLLSPEEVLQKIAEERKEYERSPISYDQVALQFLGFPSLELYHQYYRLRHSYRRLLPDPLPLETLEEHLRARELFLTNGKVQADVILCAAWDPLTRVFPKKGDPFAEAGERARAAAAELAGGASFEEVLEKFSDYPEAWPNAAQGMPQPRRGRLEPLTRNMLRSDFLGESEYLDFLYGRSIGDHLFFEAETGVVYGPVRGPAGWYLYRLVRRDTSDARPLDLEGNERHRYLVSDDYLTQRFLGFVAEALDGQEG